MKATIEAKDRREAEAIRTGLEDPAVRAFVIITGVLSPLSPRSRERVMTYVTDKLAEDAEIKSAGTQKETNGNPT